jgi:AraC-like DNA-binding protein
MWYFDNYCPEFTTEKILPDGSIELIIDLTDTPKRLYDGDNLNSFCNYKNSWISGERTGFIVVEQSQRNTMIGIHFKPGGAYPFFSFPIAELNDSVVQLDLIFGSNATTLRDQLLDVNPIVEKFAILEEFLLRQVQKTLIADRAVEYALQLISSSPHMYAIKDLAAMIGITQKHLISKFNSIIGLPPKLFTRITKFQNVVYTIGNQEEVDWASIYYGCGYYDQSHFIKDFFRFSGLNPTDYLAERGEFLNTIPIRR